MSKLSQALHRLSALRAFIRRMRSEAPQAAPLLDALERNDYQEAWEVFSSYRDVAEVLSRAPAEVKPYLALAGPFIMEALDAMVDEEAVERFLKGLGLTGER